MSGFLAALGRTVGPPYRLLRYGVVEDEPMGTVPHIILALILIEMCIQAGFMLGH